MVWASWESAAGIDISKCTLIGYAKETHTREEKVLFSNGLASLKGLSKKPDYAVMVNDFEDLTYEKIRGFYPKD